MNSGRGNKYKKIEIEKIRCMSVGVDVKIQNHAGTET